MITVVLFKITKTKSWIPCLDQEMLTVLNLLVLPRLSERFVLLFVLLFFNYFMHHQIVFSILVQNYFKICLLSLFCSDIKVQVIRRKTDNTMANRKTVIFKTLHRILEIELQEPTKTCINFMWSSKVSSPCSTSGTRRVTICIHL